MKIIDAQLEVYYQCFQIKINVGIKIWALNYTSPHAPDSYRGALPFCIAKKGSKKAIKFKLVPLKQ